MEFVFNRKLPLPIRESGSEGEMKKRVSTLIEEAFRQANPLQLRKAGL
jgi:hypothetical protein